MHCKADDRNYDGNLRRIKLGKFSVGKVGSKIEVFNNPYSTPRNYKMRIIVEEGSVEWQCYRCYKDSFDENSTNICDEARFKQVPEDILASYRFYCQGNRYKGRKGHCYKSWVRYRKKIYRDIQKFCTEWREDVCSTLTTL